jgi:hypothetical protein
VDRDDAEHGKGEFGARLFGEAKKLAASDMTPFF